MPMITAKFHKVPFKSNHWL